LARQLGVGDLAPGFTLSSQMGEVVSLKEMLGNREIVLYFYPKDKTPGCTTEAKAFRDRYEIFKEMGAEVIGVSSDSVGSHRDFANKCALPFILLSDVGGKVRKPYGVPSTFGLLPGRVTYIIDVKGVVGRVFNSQMNPAKHVEEAAKVLRSIRDEHDKVNSMGPSAQ